MGALTEIKNRNLKKGATAVKIIQPITKISVIVSDKKPFPVNHNSLQELFPQHISPQQNSTYACCHNCQRISD
jgi:hypothetical protein